MKNLKLSQLQSGKSNSNWKGGRSSDEEYKKKYKHEWYVKHRILKGREWSEERKATYSKSYAGVKHHSFKGDKAGYNAIHSWVNTYKRKPNNCEHCGAQKKLQLANKDHKYSRALDDYMYLCRSCHVKWDVEHNNYKGASVKGVPHKRTQSNISVNN